MLSKIAFSHLIPNAVFRKMDIALFVVVEASFY
jgi:hypothetical protein